VRQQFSETTAGCHTCYRYDNNSSNFRAPLRADADTGYKPVEVLPKPLCDKWAWVRWDYAGRPPRSEAQANEEYETGVQVREESSARNAETGITCRITEHDRAMQARLVTRGPKLTPVQMTHCVQVVDAVL
jgi:hypothetical protein